MSDQSGVTGGEPAEAPETGGQAAEAPATGTPPEWLAPIEERMNDLRDQNYALAEQFQSLLAYPEEEEEDEQVYEDEQGNLTPEGAQMIIDQRVDHLLGERMSAIEARNAVTARDQDFEALKAQYPDLADEANAAPIIQELAAELEAAGFGAVIQTPMFVDLIEQRYKAHQFDERAASEEPPQRGVVLESAGGAAPQQREQDVDWGERILKAAQSANPRI